MLVVQKTAEEISKLETKDGGEAIAPNDLVKFFTF